MRGSSALGLRMLNQVTSFPGCSTIRSVTAVEKGSASVVASSEDGVRAILDGASPFDELLALQADQKGIRHRPTTDRGERTFNAILDAAQAVLVDEGLRGITTRKVSDRARVNIATLYQYFDDIEAIMLALSLRFQIAQTELIYESTVELALGKGLQAWMADLTRELADRRIENQSLTVLVHATRALPYLHAVVNLGWEAGARLIATALAERDPGLSAADLLPYTRASNSVVRFTLDDAFTSDRFDRERYDLVCQMAYEFLASKLTVDV